MMNPIALVPRLLKCYFDDKFQMTAKNDGLLLATAQDYLTKFMHLQS